MVGRYVRTCVIYDMYIPMYMYSVSWTHEVGGAIAVGGTLHTPIYTHVHIICGCVYIGSVM